MHQLEEPNNWLFLLMTLSHYAVIVVYHRNSFLQLSRFVIHLSFAAFNVYYSILHEWFTLLNIVLDC